MARCGEEAGLADIGFVGRRSRLGQRVVHPREFGSAFAHALFQRLVRLFEGLICRHAGRDVAEGRNQALVRHQVAADLDDPLAAGQHHLERAVELVKAADHGLRVARWYVAPLRQHRDHVEQRKPDLADMFREIQQRSEPPVPDRQSIGGVEDRDALLHLGERRLHHVLVVL